MLGKMTRRELQNEIKRLDEVLEITARRHAALKKIVDEFQIAQREEKWRNMFRTSFTGPKKKP